MTMKPPLDATGAGDNHFDMDESKRAPLVTQLTSKFSAIHYLGPRELCLSGRAPTSIKGKLNDQEGCDLPPFPGESWFGG